MALEFPQKLRALINRESAFAQAVYGERFLRKMLPAEVIQDKTKMPEAHEEYERPAHLVVNQENWMEHPDLDLWFRAAATIVTTMRKHELAQDGCKFEAWAHQISTVWGMCQAFDNSEHLKT